MTEFDAEYYVFPYRGVFIAEARAVGLRIAISAWAPGETKNDAIFTAEQRLRALILEIEAAVQLKKTPL